MSGFENYIVQARAQEWLLRYMREKLILTDPPHRDTFVSDWAYEDFVAEWVPTALSTLRKGGYLIHSCGGNDYELKVYRSVAWPNQVSVWEHQAGFHYFFIHGQPESLTLPPRFDWAKPEQLWPTIIALFSDPGDRVLDPFCGRGEIPAAARAAGRRYAGCDIDPRSVNYCKEGLNL